MFALKDNYVLKLSEKSVIFLNFFLHVSFGHKYKISSKYLKVEVYCAIKNN